MGANIPARFGRAGLSERELWEQYWADPNDRTQECLIKHYSSFVRKVASSVKTILPNHLDSDDLFSFGNSGLLDAIDRYRDTGHEFTTFAYMRIRGSIIGELRKVGGVTRRQRANLNRVSDVQNRLNLELGRKATLEEVAAEAGMALDKVIDLLCLEQQTYVISLNEERFGSDKNLRAEDFLCAVGLVDFEEQSYIEDLARIKLRLEVVLRVINSQHLEVIDMYYFQEMTLKEIGQEIGLSESAVSLRKKKAIAAVKEGLAKLFPQEYRGLVTQDGSSRILSRADGIAPMAREMVKT